MPDHRPTIYWNPNLITDSSGLANFSFYTSDNYAPILLKMEGISENGIPGFGYLKLFVGLDK